LNRGAEKRQLFHIIGGKESSTTTLDYRLEAPQKLKMELLYDPLPILYA
jgi:hypothetical protein